MAAQRDNETRIARRKLEEVEQVRRCGAQEGSVWQGKEEGSVWQGGGVGMARRRGSYGKKEE